MRGHERERIAVDRVRERNAAAGDAHHGERIAADRVRERDRERVAVQRVARRNAAVRGTRECGSAGRRPPVPLPLC